MVTFSILVNENKYFVVMHMQIGESTRDISFSGPHETHSEAAYWMSIFEKEYASANKKDKL